MSDQTTDTTASGAEAAAAQPQLQLQDLLIAAQVIQLAGTRGAIKADEMEAVGGVYNRLVAFLQASGAIKPADKAANTPAEPTAAE